MDQLLEGNFCHSDAGWIIIQTARRISACNMSTEKNSNRFAKTARPKILGTYNPGLELEPGLGWLDL